MLFLYSSTPLPNPIPSPSLPVSGAPIFIVIQTHYISSTGKTGKNVKGFLPGPEMTGDEKIDLFLYFQ
jgi:hypothetical protein